MTPKQKANDLYHQFAGIELPPNCNYSTMGTECSKECAVIVCDEVLRVYSVFPKYQIAENEDVRFWNEVKKEIELL